MKFLAHAGFEPGRIVWLLICLLIHAASRAPAEDFRLESGGIRGGFGTGGAAQDFRQAEAFLLWNLPWPVDLGKQWVLQPKLDLSAGWLGEVGDDGDQGFVGTLGPTVALGRDKFPVQLEGGVSPTALSRDHYREKNFGTMIQFTSHIGLTCDIASRVRMGYRFQHMSNAGLGHSNPGLNLHMFSLSFLF